GAKLGLAKLERTDLRWARFDRADLEGAQLEEATLLGTIFNDTDLSNTKGSAYCRHQGPSCVDHRTMTKSIDMPIEFWRGCGLLDWQIEAAKLSQPSLSQSDVNDIGYELIRLRADQPIQLFRPFISYSTHDKRFAKRLYDDLQNNGVRCWFAPQDLKIGDPIRTIIDEAIHIYDKLLLVLSKNSVTSRWVEKEVETAFEKERKTDSTVLFPIKLDGAVDSIRTGWAADIRRTRHIGDFTKYKDGDAYQASFHRVLRDLRATP
ncbi:MAG: toll/interleukin-1 receptor domain-containing protein, partial [Geminicoccaceae bacterium]